MASNPVAAKRTRRRPKPGLRSSLRRHFRSEPTCHPRTCNQNFSGRQKRSQQDDCRNQQYSIVALTNSTAGIVERYAYSAYGEPVFATGAGVVLTESTKDIQYTYTGREWDEGLEIYHFRARMYDAGSGRFCGRDPSRYSDGKNIYCNNFLISLMDPFGQQAITVVGITPQGDFIFRPRDDGPCFVRGLDGIYEPVPCPLAREKAVGEPSLQQGISSIYYSIGVMSQVCKECNTCSCTDSECESEATAIGRALASAWQANYGQGPHRGGIPVAGWFCYDWASIFQSAVSRVSPKCFSTTFGAHGGGDSRHMEIHVWLIIVAGELNETTHDGIVVPDPACSVSFDNGYATGTSLDHSGIDLVGPDGTVVTGWPHDIGRQYSWRCTRDDEIVPFPVWPSR